MGNKPIHKPILVILISFAVAFGFSERCAHAQFPDSGFGSILPLDSLQKFIGPLLPPGGLTSTFRSELGMEGGMATLQRARVKSNQYGAFDLVYNTAESIPDLVSDPSGKTPGSERFVKYRSLDGAPSLFQFFSKTRLWRLAFNASYTSFDTLSRKSAEDGLFFSGLVMGGDIDLVRNDWLAVGASANFYFNNPRFVFKDSSLDWYNTQRIHADFSGDSPSNIGFYLRYVPPEILNFPVHFEAHYYFPLKGSEWTSAGLSLAFRPQIYRFDLSARLIFDRQFLKFSTKDRPENDQWEADFCWNIWALEFGVYF